MRNKLLNKIVAYVMALSLVLSMVPVQSINAADKNSKTLVSEDDEATEYERIEIKTAQDFVDFAKNCHIDSWSIDKYIVLENDINLSDLEEITPVAVFNGVFDGNKHTISGFNYVGDGYVVGLFRYIESKGVVKNLTLKGNIEAENEEECIGSICGVNYGTITNCTFQGTVSGRDTVGGIVGINEASGIVSKCISKGRVTAYYSTGGIVGINHGDINNCTNRSGINDDTAWVETDDEMGGVELVKNLVSNDDSEVYSGVDTGGIAGYSDGIISKCTNYGIVGYEHTGYNIGGIAGRQSGVISLCTNSGTVFGRKDVGGIAGQMEPYIEIDEAESLRNAVNKLHDLINKTLDDMDDSTEVLNSDVDAMKSYADSAIDTGDELIDHLESFVNDNLDEVNSASDRLDHIMDMIPDVLDNIDDAGDAMGRFNDIIGELSDDLDIEDKLEDTPYNETDYNRISLLSTVGGTLSSNKTSPKEGDEVVITVEPNEGYELSSLKVTDAKGNNITYEKYEDYDDKYSFEMPVENVKVEAEFRYIGKFLVSSDVGGYVTTSIDDDVYTFTPHALSGYEFNGFEVDGVAKGTDPDNDNELELDKKKEIKNGKSVNVYAKFKEIEGTKHNVNVEYGTGGTARADTNEAAVGTEVTITVVSRNRRYELKDITLNGVSIKNQYSTDYPDQYVFTMPDSEANVQVTFKYKPDDDTKVYAESGVGGNITVGRYSSNNNNLYRVEIRPHDDYDLSGDGVTVTVNSPSASIPITHEIEDDRVPEEPSIPESGTEESDNSDEGSSSKEENNPQDEGNSSEEENNPQEEVGSSQEESSIQEEGNSLEESSSPQEETSDTIAPYDDEIQVQSTGSDTIHKEKMNKEDDEDGGSYYWFILDTEDYGLDDTGNIRLYADFVKLESSTDDEVTYNISTVYNTGGTITTDATKASTGTKIYITPTSTSGYVLDNLHLSNGGEITKENDGKRYSFIMPAQSVTVYAVFKPIDIALTSNLSGDATYSGSSQGVITLTVRPDSAYTLDTAPLVKDADGKTINVSKKQSGSYVYEFNESDIGKSPCTVSITFKKQNQKQAIETSNDEISDSVGELSDSAALVQDSVKIIRDIVTNKDGSMKTWDEIQDAGDEDELISEILNLVDYVGDMSTSAAAILRNLTTIYNILEPYVSDALDAAKDDIDRATDEVESMLDSLKEANNNLKAIVNYINGQSSIKFTKLGSEFDTTKESFHDQLKDLSDSIKTLSDNAADKSEIINDDLRAVNDQLNVVLNLLADRLVDAEDLSIEELYEEVSDDDIDSITTGRVDICTNKGTVQGDINVGGIAGSMAIDDEDPEDSAAGEIEYEIGRRFITKCLVTESVNEGFVTAKKDGAGGICGYMNHGIILDSESYGSVESTEGDYAGGICGESLTIIRRCYSIASVSGGQNVGGIAGYGQTITDCYSMSNVTAQNGRVGAIAGQVASYEETPSEDSDSTTPEVYGNYYVNDELYGIDNISYVGVAEPISYNEILEVENLPTNFWHLKVIYKIEDTYLGSQEVGYGEKLDNLTYPTIPTKEGCYGVWPDVTDQKMTGVVVVEAEYKDNVTVVQSTGVENEKPLALVEDNFTEDTVLIAKFSDFEAPTEADGKEHVVYELSLIDDMVGENDVFAVRLLNPYDDDAVVYGYKDGEWIKLESKARGQYLQVEMIGSTEYFCIVSGSTQNLIIIIAAAVAAVAFILIIVLIIKRGRIRRKNRKLNKNKELKQE